MTTISPQIVEKLINIQSQIWQAVTHTVSEASAQSITFGSTLVNVTPTAELYAEMTAPRLVIQFAFSSLPENSQVLLLPPDLFTDLATLIRGSRPENVDDSLVDEIRPVLESIVQGLCVSSSDISRSAMVASDLSIRFMIFSFPQNLQKADSLVRTDVAVTGDGVNGTAMWLMDPETAHGILGIPLEADEESPFEGVEASAESGDAAAPFLSISSSEEHGLDLLMDIPLDLSVELGRVKMLVKDVVELGAGSIVEIDKAAGEPVDVLVNGRIVARGEVVVIEDNFGVRITEILSPQERLVKLNEVA